MTQTFPGEDKLPYPQILSGDVDAAATRLEMTAGTIRQRRRLSKERIACRIGWSFTEDELRLFEAFLAYKLNNGADAFYFLFPFGGVTPTYHYVRIVNGEISKDYAAPNLWTVGGMIEILPPPDIPIGECCPHFRNLILTIEGVHRTGIETRTPDGIHTLVWGLVPYLDFYAWHKIVPDPSTEDETTFFVVSATCDAGIHGLGCFHFNGHGPVFAYAGYPGWEDWSIEYGQTVDAPVVGGWVGGTVKLEVEPTTAP